MENLLLYLLKSAILLSIFYLVYHFLLKNDTSFHANRHFLLGGILASGLLPAVHFTRIVQVKGLSATGKSQLPLDALQDPSLSSGEISWWQIFGLIYLAGFVILLLRFLFQLYSLFRIIKNQPREKESGFSLISIPMELAPFSFFRLIVFNPKLHTSEARNIILEHEKVHARQWHSADVLLSQLTTAALWFNPLSWCYQKSLMQNLEYIADNEAARSVPTSSYQQTLVKIAIADYRPTIVSNFNQSFIKKRIMMLNRKPTQEKSLWKMALSLPLIFVFMVCFQVRTEAQVLAQTATQASESTAGTLTVRPPSKTGETSDNQKGIFPQDSIKPLIVVDGKIMDKAYDVNDIDPNDIATIDVKKGDKATELYGENAKNGLIEIRLKSNSAPSDDGEINRSRALYVIDGEVMKQNFNPESIDPENIELVNVIKGEKALAKYGENAKNGVIEITTGD